MYFSWFSDFVLYLKDNFIYKQDSLLNQSDSMSDLKRTVGHSDLYFLINDFALSLEEDFFDVRT